MRGSVHNNFKIDVAFLFTRHSVHRVNAATSGSSGRAVSTHLHGLFHVALSRALNAQPEVAPVVRVVGDAQSAARSCRRSGHGLLERRLGGVLGPRDRVVEPLACVARGVSARW
jgi:hypothetical protein